MFFQAESTNNEQIGMENAKETPRGDWKDVCANDGDRGTLETGLA
jgi:hypothetical protein